MTTANTTGNQNIIIQGVTDSTITVNVNGEVREISNQLAELKALLFEYKTQKVQYADKIYNIGHIDEANFGFFTGKKAFNELLTKQIIKAISTHSIPAKILLERVAAIPDWESQERISAKAKEIIAYSFVGVLGIQFSKLMAIGKEGMTDEKMKKYIGKCLDIVKRCLDLVGFAMLSKWWDVQKENPLGLTDAQKNSLLHRFDNAFELTIAEQFAFLQMVHRLFAANRSCLDFPLSELGTKGFADSMKNNSGLEHICNGLQSLQEKLDKSQYDLLDCFEAEKQLAAFFGHFHFLVNYRMASIKHISYHQIRYAEPNYLHRYAALGIDSKANVDAEKVNYTSRTVHTDAVILYRGDSYQENTNLFPFVIDFNALTFEHGSKICFYRSQEIVDGSLEYLFLEDNSVLQIERKGILRPDTDFNELMMKNENRKVLNLDCVVEQFREVRRCLVGDELNLDDI